MSEYKRGTKGWIYLDGSDNYKYRRRFKVAPENIKKLVDLPNDPSWKHPKGGITLIRYAREWNLKSAKWFLYMQTDIPHKVVERIKQLQQEGLLTDAKYNGSGDRWQFLFYVDDFDNEEEVTAMMNLLIKEFNSATFNPKEMFFKPCIYTRAKVYSGNRWGITPWIRRYNRYCEVDSINIPDDEEWFEQLCKDFWTEYNKLANG